MRRPGNYLHGVLGRGKTLCSAGAVLFLQRCRGRRRRNTEGRAIRSLSGWR